MEITEDLMTRLKSEITESDLEKMAHDFKLLRQINDAFDNDNDLYRFILLYIATFVANTGMDIEYLIRDLRRGSAAVEQLNQLREKGH